MHLSYRLLPENMLQIITGMYHVYDNVLVYNIVAVAIICTVSAA